IIRIPLLSATAKERLGYPTQKPERLLEYLLRASTNPGDIVLDPMCGGGTCPATAQRLGRKWIAIDSSKTACEIIKKRLEKLGAGFDNISLGTERGQI
ncbi:MAG: site-specific DNA-methyltransferase, partial [Thaumarchaeota archaeon]|nr:site-specific DNA-methyltransferase [Nitrososphaerota archaeon]